jgi:hypothetical protein
MFLNQNLSVQFTQIIHFQRCAFFKGIHLGHGIHALGQHGSSLSILGFTGEWELSEVSG